MNMPPGSGSELLLKNKQDVARALKHLEYSFNKLQSFDLTRTDWTEEELETLESFSSRFARCSDLVISRLLRSYALSVDPGYRGTLVDSLNLSEKQGWISSAKIWRRIRELRNVAAHEYTTEDFNALILELRQLTVIVLEANRLV